jgi:hypothetical protein
MRIRIVGVAVVATLFALATPFAYADDGDDDGGSVASLNEETFISQEVGDLSELGTSDVDGACNPMGMSTFTFEITGNAFGPYPGTFSESGTFTLNAFGNILNPVTTLVSFESTFTITSDQGTVMGWKSLDEAGTPPSFGICGLAIGMVGPEAVTISGPVTYSAEISTPNGNGEDSGTGFVDFQDLDFPDTGLIAGHQFAESFMSTAPGGDDDDDDDDDDDGGDDDDD